MIRLLRCVGLVLPLLVIGVAHGATLNFIAPLGLTEGQEVPPTGSSALGTGSADLDTVALTLTVHLTWEDLDRPGGSGPHSLLPGARGQWAGGHRFRAGGLPQPGDRHLRPHLRS